MALPGWFLLTIPFKFLKVLLLLGNRLMTWTGLYYVWRKIKSSRWAWLFLLGLNLLSLLAVVGFILYLKHAFFATD